MQKVIMAGFAGALVGAVATGAVIANAQSVPPAPPAQAADGPRADRPHWMEWKHRHLGRDMRGHGPGAMAAFALIYRQQDRQLTPPDVQKIAEAFLLWNGNHSWKVVDVASAADGAIGFALATQDGSVVARFTMDPHSGRVTRTA